MSDLITADALAAEFGLTLARFHQLRRQRKWPCVKLDRSTFLFTPEQREQIIAMHSRTAEGGSPIARTARSAARRRSA